MKAQNTMNRLSSGTLSNSDFLYGIPVTSGQVIKDSYLDNKWNTATILLYQSEIMIEGHPVKYDLKVDVVEVKTISGVSLWTRKCATKTT